MSMVGRKIHYFGAVWGVVGFTLLIGFAAMRITPYIIEDLSAGLELYQWCLLVLWCFIMVYTEGYKGFQKQFSPRFAARAFYLARHPKPLSVLLAPLFCAGYIHSTTKRIITSLSITVGVIVIVLVVRLLSQPWRGMIDIGVMLGLMYGLLSVYYFVIKIFINNGSSIDPEVR